MLRIKDIREDREMKQKDVAEFLNISQTNYSKYELGKINIPTSYPTSAIVISEEANRDAAFLRRAMRSNSLGA